MVLDDAAKGVLVAAAGGVEQLWSWIDAMGVMAILTSLDRRRALNSSPPR